MKIFLLALITFSSVANADPVRNVSELALLPQYCRGTHQINEISKDPTPMAQNVAIYGNAYTHLHHYCWALNAENKAMRIGRGYRAKLLESLGDYKYILDLAPPSFVLLPDIYTSRARVFFTLGRDAEAVRDLYKAIELKADHDRAYAQLSDYYQRSGDKNKAISILEQGISYAGNPDSVAFYIKKFERLGKTYQGTPGSALPKKSEPEHDKNSSDTTKKTDSAGNDQTAVPAKPTMPEKPSTENITPDLSGKDTSPEQPAKTNPYCRFCP